MALFGEQILRLKITLFGEKRLKERFERIRIRALKNAPPLQRRIITQLLSHVDKVFAKSARGGKPRGWKRFAKLSLFIRAKREKRRSKDPKLLLDSGLLRASNTPFVRKRGKEFGIENRLPYASIQNFGGRTKASTIAIGSFRRKKPSGGSTRVGAYKMRIKSGKRVPARPYFPNRMQAISIVKRVARDYEKEFGV